VNILLFTEYEWDKPIPARSSKSQHLLSILKLSLGDKLKVGLLDLGIGEARVQAILPNGEIFLEFPPVDKLRKSPQRNPVHLVLGHPRIPVIQRLFKDVSSMGGARISVLGTELSEKSYWKSKFWSQDEWKNHLLEGAEQGGYASLPTVSRFWSVRDFFDKQDPIKLNQLCCYFHLQPNFPYGVPFLMKTLEDQPVDELVLAVGPERGWTEKELEVFTSKGWQGLYLGDGVWRTESVGIFCSGLANHLFSWKRRET